ncbi:MAG: Acylphosphatase [Lentisphaerae bacterium ADurb.BinA184]|nr:MAG: Acylphosphatase [Lentisphaerae bacterium ADurb.BinA184]
MAVKTYRVVVRGAVTGVGFRWSACREAGRHGGLRGWIRNADDETVECLVQGESADVLDFIAWLRHGPILAVVSECEVCEVHSPGPLAPFATVP